MSLVDWRCPVSAACWQQWGPCCCPADHRLTPCAGQKLCLTTMAAIPRERGGLDVGVAVDPEELEGLTEVEQQQLLEVSGSPAPDVVISLLDGRMLKNPRRTHLHMQMNCEAAHMQSLGGSSFRADAPLGSSACALAPGKGFTVQQCSFPQSTLHGSHFLMRQHPLSPAGPTAGAAAGGCGPPRGLQRHGGSQGGAAKAQGRCQGLGQEQKAEGLLPLLKGKPPSASEGQVLSPCKAVVVAAACFGSMCLQLTGSSSIVVVRRDNAGIAL